MTDTYNTIEHPNEPTLFKEKGSKFWGYAYPISSEEEVKPHIESLRKLHHKSRHVCYAYKLGFNNDRYRANDDGEPSNSAGQPILGQINSFELTNILVVVVRYFGGTKLGVGGLIQAYRTGAKEAIEATQIIEKEITTTLRLTFEYKDMNNIMRIINQNNLTPNNFIQQTNCMLDLIIKHSKAPYIQQLITEQVIGCKIKTL